MVKKVLGFMAALFALLMMLVVITFPAVAVYWYTEILGWPPWACWVCGAGLCVLMTSAFLYLAFYGDEVEK